MPTVAPSAPTVVMSTASLQSSSLRRRAGSTSVERTSLLRQAACLPPPAGAAISRTGRSDGVCHWSLVIGHWSLVIGHWSLVTGHWLLAISSRNRASIRVGNGPLGSLHCTMCIGRSACPIRAPFTWEQRIGRWRFAIPKALRAKQLPGM